VGSRKSEAEFQKSEVEFLNSEAKPQKSEAQNSEIGSGAAGEPGRGATLQTQKNETAKSQNTKDVGPGRFMGVGGGYLVESTGYLNKYPFYMPVRVRVRACCNGH